MSKPEWFPDLSDEDIEKIWAKLTLYQRKKYHEKLHNDPRMKRLALLIALSYPEDMEE